MKLLSQCLESASIMMASVAVLLMMKASTITSLRVPYTKTTKKVNPSLNFPSNRPISSLSFPEPRKLDKTSVEKIMCRIRELNNLTPESKRLLTPFIIDKDIYGYVNEDTLSKLQSHSNVFSVKPDYYMGQKALLLNAAVAELPMAERTRHLHQVSLDFKKNGFIHGWRDEFVPVLLKMSNTPALLIERCMYSLFGFKGYGVHINGYVRNDAYEITHLWVATRSPTKSTFPGMLDHIVAGGQPYGVSPMENVIKECSEEANIPPILAKKAVPAGAVSYTGLSETEGYVKRDVLMVFDLELPLSFIPTPVDGEVEKFELHPIDTVMEEILDGKKYKPNCQLVILDFLLRHGYFSADTPGYLDIVSGLRCGDCA